MVCLNETIVEVQKARAIQSWTESNPDDIMERSIQDTVLYHRLVFHTLCRPPKERLFSIGATVRMDEPTQEQIQLSLEEVKVGECQVGSIGEIIRDEEMSYIPALFTTTCGSTTTTTTTMAHSKVKECGI
jgi:hypothetical protein